MKRAAEVTEKIIVERRIVGREFTVGVIDGKKWNNCAPCCRDCCQVIL
ncbi:hypothetical protein EBT25_05940 [bacterium]|nr:hypothetical protein [bacterium]